jgi:hypothetical protein
VSVLSCVNAVGGYISHFYIFRRKLMRRNYIARCEPGATMAMQTKAWMIGFFIFFLDCTLYEGVGDLRGHFSNKLPPSNPR